METALIKEDSAPTREFRRELSPSADLERYWHLKMCKLPNTKPERLPEDQPAYTPIDIQAFLGALGPIEIEIGCGKGGFMVEYCERHPELPFLALEKEAEIAYFAAHRLSKRQGLKHTRVILGDAFYMFRDFLPENCVQAFHMYFPDPWPKKRHHKNRLMTAEFLHVCRRIALPNAPFFWGTDHVEYNAEAQELFTATPWLKMINTSAEPTEGIQTNFEKKYRAIGKPIHRCELRILKD